MCQYLASEVHKPFIEQITPATKPEEAKAIHSKKKPPPPKKTTPLSQAAPPTQKPTTKPAAATPPQPKLPPVVSQLMEMGFEQRYIEFAMHITSSSNPERLINWLVDNQGMELPAVEPTTSPPPPVAADPAPPTEGATPTGKDQQRSVSSSSCSYGSEAGTYSDNSSSDSSDYSEGEVQEEEG